MKYIKTYNESILDLFKSKKLKKFEKEEDLHAGDLVFVNCFGPMTYSVSDRGGTYRSDKPFKPRYGTLELDKKYELSQNMTSCFNDWNTF